MGWKAEVLETAESDTTSLWDRTNWDGLAIKSRTVFKKWIFEDISASEMKIGISGALDELLPKAEGIAGWGTSAARAVSAIYY